MRQIPSNRCRFYNRMRMLCGLALVISMTTGVAAASGWVVTSTADDGSSGTLRSVIGNAAAGDTVTFNLANPSTILLTNLAQIVIKKNLTITGPGASQLMIDANSNGNDVFDIGGGVTVAISGVTLQGGYDGLDIFNSGTTVNLSAVIVRNCSAEGIYNEFGTNLSLANSTVSSNGQGGGVYLSLETTGVISQSTISGNGTSSFSNGI